MIKIQNEIYKKMIQSESQEEEFIKKITFCRKTGLYKLAILLINENEQFRKKLILDEEFEQSKYQFLKTVNETMIYNYIVCFYKIKEAEILPILQNESNRLRKIIEFMGLDPDKKNFRPNEKYICI